MRGHVGQRGSNMLEEHPFDLAMDSLCCSNLMDISSRISSSTNPRVSSRHRRRRTLDPPSYVRLCRVAICFNPVLGLLALAANYKALELVARRQEQSNVFYLLALSLAVSSVIITFCIMILATTEHAIATANRFRHKSSTSKTASASDRMSKYQMDMLGVAWERMKFNEERRIRTKNQPCVCELNSTIA